MTCPRRLARLGLFAVFRNDLRPAYGHHWLSEERFHTRIEAGPRAFAWGCLRRRRQGGHNLAPQGDRDGLAVSYQAEHGWKLVAELTDGGGFHCLTTMSHDALSLSSGMARLSAPLLGEFHARGSFGPAEPVRVHGDLNTLANFATSGKGFGG